MGSRTGFLRVAALLLQFHVFYHFWIGSVSGQVLPLSKILDAKERGERSSDLTYVPNKFIVEVEVDKLARVAGHRRAFDNVRAFIATLCNDSPPAFVGTGLSAFALAKT